MRAGAARAMPARSTIVRSNFSNLLNPLNKNLSNPLNFLHLSNPLPASIFHAHLTLRHRTLRRRHWRRAVLHAEDTRADRRASERADDVQPYLRDVAMAEQ